MNIQPISNTQINFIGRPKPDIKDLWIRGKLPQIKTGFYGDTLTIDNISREHLKPASKGGRTIFENIVLASKAKNNKRGNDDIVKYADVEIANNYLNQFADVKIAEINGPNYIAAIKATLRKLGLPIN